MEWDKKKTEQEIFENNNNWTELGYFAADLHNPYSCFNVHLHSHFFSFIFGISCFWLTVFRLFGPYCQLLETFGQKCAPSHLYLRFWHSTFTLPLTGSNSPNYRFSRISTAATCIDEHTIHVWIIMIIKTFSQAHGQDTTQCHWNHIFEPLNHWLCNSVCKGLHMIDF